MAGAGYAAANQSADDDEDEDDAPPPLRGPGDYRDGGFIEDEEDV
jgi:hypothetical protein